MTGEGKKDHCHSQQIKLNNFATAYGTRERRFDNGVLLWCWYHFMEGLEGMGNVSFCFFLLLSFVGKSDVFFPKLDDSPFLASSGLLAIFPLNMFVAMFFSMFCENKDIWYDMIIYDMIYMIWFFIQLQLPLRPVHLQVDTPSFKCSLSISYKQSQTLKK